MKTYLMSIPKSLKGVSDKLNVKSLLCEKTWIVFHEETKVIFIFQKGGSLIVSQNGEASKGQWEYIKSNKTILIEAEGVMLLLHPTFVDDVLFVLQQDGTDTYLILIDEEKIDKFVQKTTATINDYLKEISGEERESKQKEEQEKKHQRIMLARERAKEDIAQATKELHKKRKRVVKVLLLLLILFFCEFLGIFFHIAIAQVLMVVTLFALLVFLVILEFANERISVVEDSIVNNHLQQIIASNEIP